MRRFSVDLAAQGLVVDWLQNRTALHMLRQEQGMLKDDLVRLHVLVMGPVCIRSQVHKFT